MWSWSGILGIFRAWVGGGPVVDHGVGSCVMIVRHLDPVGKVVVSCWVGLGWAGGGHLLDDSPPLTDQWGR